MSSLRVFNEERKDDKKKKKKREKKRRMYIHNANMDDICFRRETNLVN